MAAHSIGATLREERLRRGKDLATIAAETKICLPILEAFENDQFDCVPSGAYRRLFLRQYARVLGLDEDGAVAAFRHQYDEPPLPLPTPPKTRPYRHVSEIACLLLAAAAVAGLYKVSGSGRSEKYVAMAALPPHANSAPNPPASQSTRAASVPNPQPPSPAANAPAMNAPPANAPATPNPPAASPSTPLATTAQTGSDPTTGSADRTAAVRVGLAVTEPVWVSVKCDGTVSYSGTLSAAESKTFEASGSVIVLVGNAGGLSISLNGKPVGPIGAHGETMLLELTPNGARRLPRRASSPPAEGTAPEV